MNLMHFLNRSAAFTSHADRQFFRSDEFPLDDESLCDTAINAMLLIMNNSSRAAVGVKTSDLSIADYAAMVQYGIRFAWKDRIALGNQLDLVNDELPDTAVIGHTAKQRGLYASATYATRALKRPRFSALAGATQVYRVGNVKGYNQLSRAHAADSNDIESVVTPGYAGIMPDGMLVGCEVNGAIEPLYAHELAYVMGLHNDRRYFWEVSAVEPYLDNLPAKVHFSIDESYIKSLFYARQLPMTERGRMRPILHWVRAHQRRLQEGIDIDVEKHLRGIDSFNMHGVDFQIGQPRKRQPDERKGKKA